MKKFNKPYNFIEDKSRFYKISESNDIWIYDAHAHNVFSLSRTLYNALFLEKNQLEFHQNYLNLISIIACAFL